MMRRSAPFALAFPQDRYPLAPRAWSVTTAIGNVRTTHRLNATTAAFAILRALRIGGTNCSLVACLKEGNWA
jgi:hypothetical protein